MERETTCRSADVIGYLVTVSVDRQLLSVDRQLLSVDRQLLSVDWQLLSVDRQLLSGDRQLLMVDRQLRKCRSTVTKCRSTVTKCRSTVTKCRLLVKRVTFHVPNGPPYKMDLVYPIKFCIRIVFNFSWDSCNTHEKWKTKVMQHLGGGWSNKEDFWRCASGE